MAFEMKKNPLEQNPLFITSVPEPEKAPTPETPPAARRGPRPAADKDEYKRATFIVRKDLLEKLKDKAYLDRKDIKQLINEILEEALKETE